ncbi:MepB family protein [Embleya sp. AB8]|uniref:MepB family protein n=1 Tax=Embleya sp. AB8 TaxID=3156304 RepID=UPI003C72F4B3
MRTNPDDSAAHGPWPSTHALPADLIAAKALVYDPAGFVCTPPRPEPESADYAAHTFTVNGARVRFRVGRTTPTKVGQFVTLWQRSAAGPIEPFDIEDPLDLVVISSRNADGNTDGNADGNADADADAEGFGQFVFPSAVLGARGILTVGRTGGKRGFRIYPPWVTTTNRQARSTQTWQLNHFLPIPPNPHGPVDLTRARTLYGEHGAT